ncbi:hypothetical protein PQX77_010481 [Marasmius sp. AFHP31]|nr:hypothetical protein PQX77_010481 [Marasmius sp. AFHP31]
MTRKHYYKKAGQTGRRPRTPYPKISASTKSSRSTSSSSSPNSTTTPYCDDSWDPMSSCNPSNPMSRRDSLLVALYGSKKGAGGKEISEHAKMVILNGATDDKLRHTFGAKQQMYRWADENGYEDDPLLPPSESFLVNYVSRRFAEKMSDDTARKHMQLLKHHYELKGYEWQGSTLLREALRGCKRLRPSHSFRKERDPVTKERLDVMERNLDLGDEDGTRLGEILASNSSPSAYNHLLQPVAKDLKLISEGTAYTLFLPSTKTDTSRRYSDDSIPTNGPNGPRISNVQAHRDEQTGRRHPSVFVHRQKQQEGCPD